MPAVKRRLSFASGSSGRRSSAGSAVAVYRTPKNKRTPSYIRKKLKGLTPTSRVIAKRQINYRSAKQQGQYAGKFSRGKKRDEFSKYTLDGAVIVNETGYVLTGVVNTNAIYVGHATHSNTLNIQKVFWLTVLRNLFEKAGLQIIDFESAGVGQGYQVSIIYSTDLTTAKQFIDYTVGAVLFEAAANTISTLWKNVWDTLAGQKEAMLIGVELKYGASPNQASMAYIDLRESMVECYVKSDLKVQNRTLALGTDDDINSTENVANQPLYGKSYSGKGSGMVPKDAKGTFIPLVCSTRTGMFAKAATATESKMLGEPPSNTLFAPRPQMHRASLEPGKIKTSTIRSLMRVKMVDFWNMLRVEDAVYGLVARTYCAYGKFHILALEKNICATTLDTQPSVGLELNQKMGLRILKYKKQHSAELNLGSVFL